MVTVVLLHPVVDNARSIWMDVPSAGTNSEDIVV